MATNPKIDKINAIYKDFQTKLQTHRKRVREIVSLTLKKVAAAHTESIRKSIKD